MYLNSCQDLDQKYNTLLQMYGEKVEETEELQLDLADVKTMYKAQVIIYIFYFSVLTSVTRLFCYMH